MWRMAAPSPHKSSCKRGARLWGGWQLLCALLQAEMGGRAAKTRAALDALDPAQRLAMEGHRPGAYLRLRFSGEPDTFVY